MHILLLFFTMVVLPACWAEMKPMKFKAPTQSDEETHSSFLPDALKCDACQAISYQMFERFSEFNRLHKHYGYKLPESEVIGLVEQACYRKYYERYGLKTVNDENRLNGPGIEESDKVAGMIAGGGKWPGRLSIICDQFVEEVGDDAIYEAYRQSPKNAQVLYKFLCEDTERSRSVCLKKSGKMEREL